MQLTPQLQLAPNHPISASQRKPSPNRKKKNRRQTARAFSSALGKLAGDRPVLLPQVRPLGDLEEDEPPFAPGELGLDLPPAIAPLTRRFEMARMIVEEFEPGLKPLRALEMADALGGFLDSCQLEEVQDLSRIAGLADELWRGVLRFAATVTATEITGSETFLHLDHEGARWVGLVPGVRTIAPGARVSVFVDPARVLVFHEDGSLASGAAAPLAA